jgi:hypothetical protein
LRWQQQRIELIRKRVQEEVESELETETSLVRKSTPFLRAMVHSIDPKENRRECALLTIWNPTEDQRNIIKEGETVQAFNLGVRGASYDGTLQVSANGRTTIESYPIEDHSLIERVGFQPRQLLSVFHFHKLSRLAGSQPKNQKWAQPIDVDVAGIQVHAVEPNETDNDHKIYLTDESGLMIRIHSKKMLNAVVKQNGLVVFPIVGLRDVRVFPFDDEQDCAVAEHFELSSTLSSHRRLDELELWASASNRNVTMLLRLANHVKAKLPLHHQLGEQKIAMGYILHISLSKRENKMFITVDCNGFDSHIFEVPIIVMHQMIQIAREEVHRVTLCRTEEDVDPSLGCLSSIFRCRGFLWRFLIRRSVGSTNSQYVIEKAWKMDKVAFSKVMNAWEEHTAK